MKACDHTFRVLKVPQVVEYPTVTIEVQVLELPAASVTVKVTVLIPTLLELNVDLSMDKNGLGVHTSVEPLLISAGVIVALPVPSSVTESAWQEAVGGVVS